MNQTFSNDKGPSDNELSGEGELFGFEDGAIYDYIIAL